MKKTVGIFAHVDAGKTTFSERALYLSGAIARLGRVDHQDAFLDAHPLERQRGITIFSGLARLSLYGDELYWLDTPGHADFSPEMERALSVIDYAVLLVSAAEGVQSHAETLWRLLEQYRKPVYVFLNKMDRAGADAQACLAQLRALSPDVVDMSAWQSGDMDQSLIEELAGRDEGLLETYLRSGYDEKMCLQAAQRLIKQRLLFPVFVGSALTGQGVEGFLRRFCESTVTDYQARADEPARLSCYQIRHDAQGVRLCFMKLLSGRVRVKQELTTAKGASKINELRLYHGERYQTTDCAEAGELIAVMGLEGVNAGDVLDAQKGISHLSPYTEPMLAADAKWDHALVSAPEMMRALRILEQEEPTLSVMQTQGAVTLRVMGKIQLEVLSRLVKDRFGYEIAFGKYRVLYQETIQAPVIGIGHYEPLRHYAEVHLRLAPAPRGTGIRFVSLCHVDALSLNWQRLIETHVLEKAHKGVMTGSPLADVTVELLSGRAHLKHTEGGDFRQATYRAIRNALMYADNVLLEPVCRFALRVPSEQYGRVTGDLSRMGATLEGSEPLGGGMLLKGLAVYARMLDYQETFLSVTHGKGGFDCRMDHYEPCSEQEQVVKALGYQPLADDTPDSVFCQKGAGYQVPWDEVRSHAHLPVEQV